MTNDTNVETARSRVRTGEAYVRRQRDIVADLRAANRLAQETLANYEEILAMEKEHLAYIEAKVSEVQSNLPAC